MGQHDPARDITDALGGHYADDYPLTAPLDVTPTSTLKVDDDYKPTVGAPTLLVADDGGPRVHPGAWLKRKDLTRPLIRLTAFAAGRDQARALVVESADWICDHKPTSIARIEDVSTPLVTRDRATGAYLASITMPVIVKPLTV